MVLLRKSKRVAAFLVVVAVAVFGVYHCYYMYTQKPVTEYKDVTFSDLSNKSLIGQKVRIKGYLPFNYMCVQDKCLVSYPLGLDVKGNMKYLTLSDYSSSDADSGALLTLHGTLQSVSGVVTLTNAQAETTIYTTEIEKEYQRLIEASSGSIIQQFWNAVEISTSRASFFTGVARQVAADKKAGAKESPQVLTDKYLRMMRDWESDKLYFQTWNNSYAWFKDPAHRTTWGDEAISTAMEVHSLLVDINSRIASKTFYNMPVSEAKDFDARGQKAFADFSKWIDHYGRD